LLIQTSSVPCESDEGRPAAVGPGVRFVDTTMLYAPKSGGVKRYLTAKRAWLSAHRPLVQHSLVVPGEIDAHDGEGLWSIYTASLPLSDGYRFPFTKGAWCKRLIKQMPDLIEAGDPYTPGLAAQLAGQKLGIPVIGFCHTDVVALAQLHIGEWSLKTIRKKWAQIYGRFDKVVAPSRHMAARLAEEGVDGAIALPLGVDVQTFNPERGDRERLRAKLEVSSDTRLLVFAGRPAREKRLDVLVEAVERLGDPYRLLLIGAGEGAPPSDLVLNLPYESSLTGLARLLASCDAFVHANVTEPFGLVALEAMACGLPVVAPPAGGVAESVDEHVGQLATRQDPEAFAEAIEALFARDIRAIGAEARRRTVEQHRWDAVFDRLSRVYADVSGAQAFLSPGKHAVAN
jgi:alpha-1,6-mannosyltransferase